MSLTFACHTNQLDSAEGLEVTLTNEQGQSLLIAIIRDEDGGWHAVDGMCTHGEVNLFDCDVEGCLVECWGHGATFDLNTGQATLPATENISVYPVTIVGEEVLVDLEAGRKV